MFNLEDIKFKGIDFVSLNKIYEELEFYSYIKKNVESSVHAENDINFINVKSKDDLNKLDNEIGLYIECDKENYHEGNIVGLLVILRIVILFQILYWMK